MENIYLRLVQKECPHCKQIFEGNHSGYANHIRWCISNPNRDEMLHNMKSKIKNRSKRMEKKPFDVKCEKCGKIFQVFENPDKFPSKKKYYCCRSCANSRKMNHTTRNKIKKSIAKFWENNQKTAHICIECGKGYRNQNKKFCSIECRNKYRNEHLNKTKLEQYRDKCSFKFNLSDFPDEFDFEMIRKYGWYSAANNGGNIYGVSRDHMVSVNYGFKHNIDPKIISHPANCQLLLHSDNSSKCDKCSITYDELVERIKRWDEKYNSI